MTPEIWQEIQSSPELVKDMLDDLKRGNHYYSAIETDKGVLLFDNDMDGEWQFKNYMYKYVENGFFEPDFSLKSLTIHELSGWPSVMEGKVNLCKDDSEDRMNEDTMEPFVYQDKTVLKNVVESTTYALAPTWKNYHKLTDAEKGLGLTRSPDNYDRMTLLFIKEQGYPIDGLVDEYPDNFSFHDKFEEIESRMLGRNRWEMYDEMQEKAKKLAGDLLNEHFPDMRQSMEVKEVKVENSMMERKNKGLRI